MTRQTHENEEDGSGDGAVVDALLREHFAAALDGQVGRAGRAFERHIAANAAAASSRTDVPVATTRLVFHPTPAERARRRWLIAALGTGLAASVAAVFIVAMTRHATPTPMAGTSMPIDAPPRVLPAPVPQVGKAGSAFHFQIIGESVSHHAQVEGLVVIDDRTPARIVRERAVERTQWVDEQRGLRIETIVPREDVKLIALETH